LCDGGAFRVTALGKGEQKVASILEGGEMQGDSWVRADIAKEWELREFRERIFKMYDVGKFLS
jgi:hypothetical protein